MAFKQGGPLGGGGRQEHISIQLDAVRTGNLACRVWQRGRGWTVALVSKREWRVNNPRCSGGEWRALAVGVQTKKIHFGRLLYQITSLSCFYRNCGALVLTFLPWHRVTSQPAAPELSRLFITASHVRIMSKHFEKELNSSRLDEKTRADV